MLSYLISFKQSKWYNPIIVGISVFIGAAVISIVEGIAAWIHPPDPSWDMKEVEFINKYAESAPPYILMLIPFAWMCGALVSGFLSTLMTPLHYRLNRLIPAGLFSIMGIMMLSTYFSTWYMWAMTLLLIFPSAFLGTAIGRKIRRADL
jgi:hypothetical protein